MNSVYWFVLQVPDHPLPSFPSPPLHLAYAKIRNARMPERQNAKTWDTKLQEPRTQEK